MKIVHYFLLFLISVSLLGFSSAYQTFEVSNERFDSSSAIIIVDMDSSKVTQQETTIKLYPDQIEKHGYSELLNYASYINKDITSFTVFSEDKTALNMGPDIKIKTGLSVNVISEGSAQSDTIKLENKKPSMSGLSSITTGSVLNLDKNSPSTPKIYTPIILGIFILLILIIIGLLHIKK